jgi:hypothetical protein
VQRRQECGGKMRVYKNKDIKKLESEISSTNSRTTSISLFQEYLKARWNVEAPLYKHHSQRYY